MSKSSYDGLVQMQPNFKNGDFFSGDDDFNYQVPRVYFECLGEEDLKYIREVRPVKSYMIEEFDWNKSEKRRYKVVLEETSKLEDYEQRYLKKVIARDSEDSGKEYMLTQS